MRSVIIATGRHSEGDLLTSDLPELRPLAGRPWIEHVIEYLQARGITRFSVLLCRSPEKIRNLLGDGQRWGCTIDYYPVKDPEHPYDRLKTLPVDDPRVPFLLADGACVPDLSEHADLNESKFLPPCFFTTPSSEGENQEEQGGAWTGYAVLTQRWLRALPTNCERDALVRRFRSEREKGTSLQYTVPRALDGRHHARMLDAHESVLSGKFEGLLLKNNEVEPGVWIARNVVLHPTARVEPPVFIGEDTRIEAGVELGPHAVVGPGCVIDRKATVRHSVVHSGSYVGEGLEVSRSIVDRNLLINARVNASLSISENFMLGSIRGEESPGFWNRLPSRIFGAFLLVAFLPFLLLAILYAWLRGGRPLFRLEPFLVLPAGEQPRQWRTGYLLQLGAGREERSLAPMLATTSLRDFLLSFMPGLLSVVFGKMHVVGLPPRPPKQVEQLPEHWRDLYLKGKAGLITENLIYHDAADDPDDSYAAETFYAATESLGHDAKLLLSYFAQLLLLWG